MNESERVDLINKLKSQREEACKEKELIPEEVTGNVALLDSLLHTDYSCRHDYGIKSGNDCTCLDCGTSIKDSSFGSVLKAHRGTDIKKIRQKYLEFLLYISTNEAVNMLEKVYDLKLIKLSTQNKN